MIYFTLLRQKKQKTQPLYLLTFVFQHSVHSRSSIMQYSNLNEYCWYFPLDEVPLMPWTYLQYHFMDHISMSLYWISFCSTITSMVEESMETILVRAYSCSTFMMVLNWCYTTLDYQCWMSFLDNLNLYFSCLVTIVYHLPFQSN
jgi:hypothetical protein